MKASTIYKIGKLAVLLACICYTMLFLSCDSRDFVDERSGYRIVSFTSNQSILFDDNGTTTAEIEVLVHNSVGQPAAGQVIRFSSNMTQLRIEPPNSDDGGGGGSSDADPNARFTTNGSGIVKAIVSLSGKALEAGIDSTSVTINAWLNEESSPQRSLKLNVISTTGIFLRWVNEGTIELSVEETGGIDSQFIVVKVADMSGNLVTDVNRIRFKIRSAPNDVKINGQPSSYQPIVSTDGGLARALISSGQTPGNINLEAELLDSSDEPYEPPIRINRNNIIVTSGPPEFFEMFLPYGGTGRSVNAGAWQIVLAANISDAYFNPVRSGTSVSFSLENLRRSDYQNTTPIETITNPLAINGSATVGNFSVEGDSTAGVAYTYMTYHGTYANHYVDIIVGLGIDDEVIRYPFKLPMQSPNLSFTAYPEFIQWETTELTQPALRYKSLELLVKVIDGQNNPIFNAPLHFTTNGGSAQGDPSLDSFRDRTAVTAPPTPPVQPLWENPSEHWLDDSGITTKPATQYEAPTDFEGEQRKLFYWDRNMFDPGDLANPTVSTATVSVQIIGWENTLRQIEVRLIKWK